MREGKSSRDEILFDGSIVGVDDLEDSSFHLRDDRGMVGSYSIFSSKSRNDNLGNLLRLRIEVEETHKDGNTQGTRSKSYSLESERL